MGRCRTLPGVGEVFGLRPVAQLLDVHQQLIELLGREGCSSILIKLITVSIAQPTDLLNHSVAPCPLSTDRRLRISHRCLKNRLSFTINDDYLASTLPLKKLLFLSRRYLHSGLGNAVGRVHGSIVKTARFSVIEKSHNDSLIAQGDPEDIAKGSGVVVLHAYNGV